MVVSFGDFGDAWLFLFLFVQNPKTPSFRTQSHPSMSVLNSWLRTEFSCCQQALHQLAKDKDATWPVSTGPWHRIHADFAESITEKLYSSWYYNIKFMNKKTSVATIEVLYIFQWSLRFVSSSDWQLFKICFTIFNIFFVQTGIRHYMGAPYHPATNGRAERMVETVKSWNV